MTGSDGFLGSTLVRDLLERGQKVRAGVLSDLDAPALAGLDCERRVIDVTSPDSLRAGLEGTDAETILVHCAGMMSISDRVNPIVRTVNVDGTQNVIDACREQGVGRLVQVSSVHALPENPELIIETKDLSEDAGVGEYAKTKAEATRRVLAADDIDRVIVHPSGIIDPGDPGEGHMTRMVRDLASGSLPAVVKGRYDFVDMRDVTAGIIGAAVHPLFAVHAAIGGELQPCQGKRCLRV